FQLAASTASSYEGAAPPEPPGPLVLPPAPVPPCPDDDEDEGEPVASSELHPNPETSAASVASGTMMRGFMRSLRDRLYRAFRRRCTTTTPEWRNCGQLKAHPLRDPCMSALEPERDANEDASCSMDADDAVLLELALRSFRDRAQIYRVVLATFRVELTRML